VSTQKYDAIAEEYSAHDYADAERYYARRAKVVAAQLDPGASLLDFACGDGGFGRHLVALGIDYRGVDASEPMVEVARRALGDRIVLGRLDYTPPDPVDATTIFALLPGAGSEAFEHLHSFTRQLIFDLDRAHEPARSSLTRGWWLSRVETGCSDAGVASAAPRPGHCTDRLLRRAARDGIASRRSSALKERVLNCARARSPMGGRAELGHVDPIATARSSGRGSECGAGEARRPPAAW
jgi:SAM-dependent methyltransferase